MTDQALMTEIMGKIMKINDHDSLRTIQGTAFSRARDLRQKDAAVETASWMVGDEVQLLPEHRDKRPYGAKGKIEKINKVKIKVDFGNNQLWNIPKSMLMKAE